MSQISLISWDIYEIHTAQTEIHGVMLRGRIRKLGLEQSFNVICENATDEEKCVRFAVLRSEDAERIAGLPEKYYSQRNCYASRGRCKQSCIVKAQGE